MMLDAAAAATSSASACDVLGNPASRSDQRWHAYRLLLESLERRSHIWCQHGASANFLCGLLEFPGSDLFQRFQQVLHHSTRSCRSCVAIWAESITKFLQSLPNRFEDYSIDVLESHMREADAKRLSSLAREQAAFELVRRVHLARHRSLNRLSSALLASYAHTASGEGIAVMGDGRLAPVIYLFCLHPEPVVRAWCQSLVRARPIHAAAVTIPSSVTHEILAVLTRDLFADDAGVDAADDNDNLFRYNAAEFWSGLHFLLEAAPEPSHAAVVADLLLARPGVLVESVLSHTGLARFDSDGTSYCVLFANVSDRIFTPALSCLSWLMLNASDVFWEQRAVMGPAVFADLLRKGVMGSLKALVDAPHLSLKLIDLVPIFVMSLPGRDRHDYVGSAIRFLLQVVANFPSTSSQRPVLVLKIHIWSAVFKMVRCSYMMGSAAAVIACEDGWAAHLAAFACSDSTGPSTQFLTLGAQNVRDALVADAVDAIRAALHHDVERLKSIFTADDSSVLARNGALCAAALWHLLSTKYRPDQMPSALLQVVLGAFFHVVAVPPSFVALGFEQPDDVIAAYSAVRTVAQSILQAMMAASRPRLVTQFAAQADVPGLFLLLISYRDSSASVGMLMRAQVQAVLKLRDQPASVSDCLSLLYQQQPSLLTALYDRCFQFVTNTAVVHAVQRLVRGADHVTDAAAGFLADLYPSIFWLDRLLHLFSGRDMSLDTDPIWDLFYKLVVSCLSFHPLPEFDRVFSALFDLGLTLLSVKPAILSTFRRFVKSWLQKRDLIPAGTRRRWFQFVRGYARTFPDAKNVVRSVLCKYHADLAWLYNTGLVDQAHRNYLVSLVPSAMLSEAQYHQRSDSTPNGVLANLMSRSAPKNAYPVSTDDGATKTSKLRAGFQSLRDDPELSRHASVIKSIGARPLTSLKKSSALKRRGAVSIKNAVVDGAARATLKEQQLPVRSLGHFLGTVLDWTIDDVTGDALPKLLSELMMSPLPTRFDSFIEYRKAYGPLLLEETRAMLQSDYESAMRDPKPIIVVKHGVDATPTPSLPGSLMLCSPSSPADPQHQQHRLSESDLVLVWPIADDAHYYSLPAGVRFGVVDAQSNATRILIRMTQMLVTDAKAKDLHAVLRVSSLVTALRLARALSSVERLRLSPAVVLGQADTSMAGPLNDAIDAEDPVLLGLNASQRVAIQHCIGSKDPVVLLQGPPGTGKSTVIVALIKALLERGNQHRFPSQQLGHGWRRGGDFDFRHILLCTPSNAAADELTSRLVSAKIQGVPDTIQYPVIRYGSNVTSNAIAESVSLDRLASTTQSAMVRPGSQFETNPTAPTVSSTDRRSLQELRERLLSEANVLVCTLSGSGASLIGNISHAFQVVIVDEAAQAHEIETLIPLQYSCRKVILVGDPRQLPATVLSTSAGKFGLNRSMFERLENSIQPVMLTEQYRMHPEICLFPSKQFYQGRVITAGIDRAVPIHGNRFTRPYLFFDVQSEDRMVNFSRKNVTEADFVVHLLRHIERTVALYGMPHPSIGVVTPYQAQVNEIRVQASKQLKYPLDVRTIDSFQGQERDIIVISAVRASSDHDPHKGLGFVADGRRLNVALTRAKLCCLVVGSAKTLSESVSVWKDLITDANDRNCLVPVPPTRENFDRFLQQSCGSPRKRPAGSEIPALRQTLPLKKQATDWRPMPKHIPRIGPVVPPNRHIARQGRCQEQTKQGSAPPAHPTINPVAPKAMPRLGTVEPPPLRRRKTGPGARPSRLGPDPEAIRRQATAQRNALLPSKEATKTPRPSFDATAEAPLQKSTATLALDDILGAM